MLATLPVIALALAAPPVPATIADARFIAGHWIADEEGTRSEEVWTTPAGDGMIGMWRAVAGGKLRVLEFLSLAAEDGTLVLRFRFFDPRLVGREERDRPLVLPLVRRVDGLLRFEGPRVDGSAGLVALTYAARPGGLEVTLEKDGKVIPFTFRKGP